MSYPGIMSRIRRYSTALSSILLFLATVTVLVSLGVTVINHASRAMLLDVLAAVGALLIGIAGLVGLHTWRKKASRELAQRVLKTALTLCEKSRDWAVTGSSSVTALGVLVSESGELVDSPWASRDEVLRAILGEVRASRRRLVEAKLAWAVALEEARASAWAKVAEAGDWLTVSVEILNAQLGLVEARASLWKHSTNVADPGTARTSLHALEEQFGTVPEAIRNSAGKVQKSLECFLGL